MGRADHDSNSHNPPRSQSIVVADGQTVVEGDQVGSSPRKPKGGGKTSLPEANVTESAERRVRFGRCQQKERGNTLIVHSYLH